MRRLSLVLLLNIDPEKSKYGSDDFGSPYDHLAQIQREDSRAC